jgi:hypothetical protein
MAHNIDNAFQFSALPPLAASSAREAANHATYSLPVELPLHTTSRQMQVSTTHAHTYASLDRLRFGY